MVCPRCQSLISDEVEQCACGYRFETQPTQSREPERFNMFGTTFLGEKITESPASEDAKSHLIRSVTIAGIVAVLFLVLLTLAHVRVFVSMLLAGLLAYLAWASYWGIVAATNAVADLGEQKAPEGFLGEFMMHVAVEALALGGMVLLPIVLGILYGILGGGVYEFLKYRKIANNPNYTAK